MEGGESFDVLMCTKAYGSERTEVSSSYKRYEILSEAGRIAEALNFG